MRDYFGKAPHHIKAAVCQSTEYKEYAEQRRRSPAPPPPEMSLVTPNLTETLGTAAGTKRGAPDPDPTGAGTPGALPGNDARARNFDVAGEALSGASPVPPPQSQCETMLPVIALTARRN